jgi:N-glycosylase/DNA lyase
LRIRVRLPASFSFDAVVRSHGWYDLPPFVYDRERGELTTRLPGTAVSFRAVDGGGALEASSAGLSREELSRVARRVFALELDFSSFAASLSAGSPLARGLERGGGRILRAPGLFEDAVKMLFTTNCSWAATRGMVVRLVALAGRDGAFPEPEAVARLTPARLAARVRCGYRAAALSRFARRVASGKLDLSAWERTDTPAAAVREAILDEHGFGPYAAEGLLRILGRHDYLALDSWIRKRYREVYPGRAKSLDRAIGRRYARFGEYRGLALWLDMTREWHEGDEPAWP